MKGFFSLLAAIAIALSGLGDLRGQCDQGQCPQGPQGGRSILRGGPIVEKPAAKHEVAVRIIVGSREYGSGVIVDACGGKAKVLTAAHVLREASGKDIVVVVVGKRYQARVVGKLDVEGDLAMLEIDNPGVGMIGIEKGSMATGSSGWICGFGRPGSGYRSTEGRYVGPVSPNKGKTWGWGEFAVGARQGDSGGPIINKDGMLIGIITGTDYRMTCGPCLPRIRMFLRGVMGVRRERPLVLIPGPQIPVPIVEPLPQIPITPEVPGEIIPVAPLSPAIDYDKLVALIWKRIEANKDSFRGPAGKDGQDGALGMDGAVGVAKKERIKGSFRFQVRPIPVKRR